MSTVTIRPEGVGLEIHIDTDAANPITLRAEPGVGVGEVLANELRSIRESIEALRRRAVAVEDATKLLGY